MAGLGLASGTGSVPEVTRIEPCRDDTPGDTESTNLGLPFCTFTISNGRTGAPLEIEDADKQNAWFTVPASFSKAGTSHLILEVTDTGTPALTRYQRFAACRFLAVLLTVGEGEGRGEEAFGLNHIPY